MKFMLSFLSILCIANLAYAQTSTELVWEQLQDAYNDASEEGYTVKNYLIGGLESDEDASWQFHLYSGKTYQIIGVCDIDCSDIDMYLMDMDDNDLVSDDLDDDFPMLDFTPSYSGTYQIDLTMFKCEMEPCYYGIALFVKDED